MGTCCMLQDRSDCGVLWRPSSVCVSFELGDLGSMYGCRFVQERKWWLLGRADAIEEVRVWMLSLSRMLSTVGAMQRRI
jgi:hypothetical protein